MPCRGLFESLLCEDSEEKSKLCASVPFSHERLQELCFFKCFYYANEIIVMHKNLQEVQITKKIFFLLWILTGG